MAPKLIDRPIIMIKQGGIAGAALNDMDVEINNMTEIMVIYFATGCIYLETYLKSNGT